eukprot:2354353-Lingulodinium_polyedra.AAC.1
MAIIEIATKFFAKKGEASKDMHYEEHKALRMRLLEKRRRLRLEMVGSSGGEELGECIRSLKEVTK